MTLIEFLTTTNQSLLNQVRAKDVATLAGLQTYTGEPEEPEPYMSTEDRELAAAIQAMAANKSAVGEPLYDDADVEAFRSVL